MIFRLRASHGLTRQLLYHCLILTYELKMIVPNIDPWETSLGISKESISTLLNFYWACSGDTITLFYSDYKISFLFARQLWKTFKDISLTRQNVYNSLVLMWGNVEYALARWRKMVVFYYSLQSRI